MQILESLLVIAHLLGMAGFIAAFFVQRRTAPESPLVSLWPWCVLVMTLSGFGLVAVGVITSESHDPVKMAIKGTLMTILGVTVLVLFFRRRPAGRTVPSALAAGVVAEVAVSVLIA